MHSDHDIKLVEEYYDRMSLQQHPVEVKIEDNKIKVICDKAVISGGLIKIPKVPVHEFTGHLFVVDSYIKNLTHYNLPRVIGKSFTIRTDFMGSFKGSPDQVRSLHLTKKQKTSETHKGPLVAQENYPRLNSLTGLPQIIEDELLI